MKLALGTMLAAVLLTCLTPAVAFAEHRGGFGRPGGHAYYGGRGYYGGQYYGGRAYYGRPYLGGPRFTFGFGFGPAYVYAPPPPCVPAGYYDRHGRWHPYPGCYAVPYGY